MNYYALVKIDRKGFLLSIAAFTFACVTLAGLGGCGSGSSVEHFITQPTSNNNQGNTTPPTGTVLVADTLNNRVLLYEAPVNTGQSASIVLGQPDFKSSVPTTSPNGLNNPVSTIEDSQGNLWISDWGNNRLLEFKPPLADDMNASLVIGQPDLTSNTPSADPAGLAFPRGLVFDENGNLWVADTSNSRVLEFVPPFMNGMSYSLELGKTIGLGTGACSSPDRGLCNPTALAFDSNGDLWVVDNNNNRILKYTQPFTATESPAIVLGQPDFVSKTLGAGPANLNYPWGLAFDVAGNLWVSDALNWRVLQYKPPFSNGEAATLVLGLPDFTSPSPSNLQVAMSNPREIVFDKGGDLLVVDGGHSRVMVFEPPFATGMPASKVLGQPDFTSVGGSTSASGLSGAVGVSISN